MLELGSPRPAHICPKTGGCRGCCCTGTLPPNHTVSDVGIFPRRIRLVRRHQSLPLLRLSVPLLRLSVPIGAVVAVIASSSVGRSQFPADSALSFAADFDVSSYYSLVRRRTRAPARPQAPACPSAACCMLTADQAHAVSCVARCHAHVDQYQRTPGLSRLRSRRPRLSRRSLRGTRRLRRL